MIEALEYDIEFRAEKAENLSFCQGIKLVKIKDTVAQMLEQIGKNRIFEQYTVHSISHVNEMLKIVEWLIPENVKNEMHSAEWLMLTLAIYLHDLGMVVSNSEYQQRNENVMFCQYKEEALENNPQEYINYIKEDEYLYQEFVRENHAVRIRDWLTGTNADRYGQAKDQIDILSKQLSYLDEKFRIDLGMICESHHRDDIDDFTKYKIVNRYANTEDAVVNLNYIAIILRCADLLHITTDRTPTIAKKLLNISNPVSVLEWEKQQAVKAVAPKSKRNNENEIDESIEKDTIEITAHFSGPETAEAYFGLSSYLQYVEKELSNCNKIAEKAKRQEGSKYDFPWKKIDSSNISTVGFESKKLSFTLEQDNILNLLVGHTLYNDSSVVVRELTQNAIDAIRLQKLIYSKKSRTTYQGEVLIEWNSQERVLIFNDNGTGMTFYDIENYLLKVGASKYRDKEVEKKYSEFSPISRFGIGILTCFMVANDIDIETNPNTSDEINVICLRNLCGSYLLKKKPKSEATSYIKKHGTIIKLHIKPDVDMSDLEYNLKKWIITPDVCVKLKVDNNEIVKVDKPSLSDVLKDYLTEEGIKVDDISVKIEEKSIGSVTVACALKYNRYWADWSFMPLRESNFEQKNTPVGTCVEGIRVEFSTPGFKNKSILAIANVKGSVHKTNVARTALEYDSNKETLKSIYECYRLFIEDQVEILEKSNFSKSWAIDECYYIMEPILNRNRERNEPIDNDLLLKCLSDIKFMFIEKNGERKLLSVNEVKNLPKFNIVVCNTMKAIESLLREIPSKTTAQEIINTVCNDNNIFDCDNPIIVNYNEYNILHRYALSTKEVSNISIEPGSRTIKLTFTEKNGLWDVYTLFGSRSLSENNYLHIPKAEMQINGIDSEVGVSTIGGIYLKRDSELCNYIKKIIEKFNKVPSKENKMLLNAFLSNIFNSQLLELAIKKEDSDYALRRMFNSSNLHINEELIEKMWDQIDPSEFSEIVLAKNHNLFSLNNWSRKTGSQYSEFFDD